MIRGIIFDCFGVLYRGSISHLHELTPPDKRDELANLSLSADYGYVDRQDFLMQASELTGKSLDELQAIMNADHVRNKELISYVKTLRPHYKVAMLSNVGRGVMNQLFSVDELAELFDEVVLSSEVGMIKPDPNIFHFTSEKLGVLPEDCLMVDDLESNVNGAIAIGMQAVVFKTTKEFISATATLIAK